MTSAVAHSSRWVNKGERRQRGGVRRWITSTERKRVKRGERQSPAAPSFLPGPGNAPIADAADPDAVRLAEERLALENAPILVPRGRGSAESTGSVVSVSTDAGTAPGNIGDYFPDGQNPGAPQAAPADPSVSQNLQGQKGRLLGQARRGQRDTYVGDRLKPPLSPYDLKMGSVIPCTLITGLNSDLPGSVACHVRQNVFATVTGSHLLIPRESRVEGEIDSLIAFGQRRLLVVWHHLRMPSGETIALDGMQGVDLSGYAGYTGHVNNHWGRLVASVVLTSVLSAAPVLAAGDVDGFQRTPEQEIARNLGSSVNSAGQSIVQRNLNIQPTIEVDQGTAVNVYVRRDLILRPYNEVGGSRVDRGSDANQGRS